MLLRITFAHTSIRVHHFFPVINLLYPNPHALQKERKKEKYNNNNKSVLSLTCHILSGIVLI